MWNITDLFKLHALSQFSILVTQDCVEYYSKYLRNVTLVVLSHIALPTPIRDHICISSSA